MSAKTIAVAVTALLSLAACGPSEKPTETSDSAVPPVSEPTLNGGAPVTIAPGADAMYPTTPSGPEGLQTPPPVVTPESGAAPSTP